MDDAKIKTKLALLKELRKELAQHTGEKFKAKPPLASAEAEECDDLEDADLGDDTEEDSEDEGSAEEAKRQALRKLIKRL